MKQRLIIRTVTGFIAILFVVSLAVLLRAQEPFPPASPSGYLPNGQTQNGYYPGAGSQSTVVPSQPTAPVRPERFPGGHTPLITPEAGIPAIASFSAAAPAYGPTYQTGQQAPPGLSQPYLNRSPAPGGTSAGLPGAAPATLCEWSQILGRVGNDVVLTSDVLIGIDDMLARAKGKIPPEKMPEQRALLVAEVTEGIKELNAHYTDPDPVKAMSPQHAGLINQLVRQQIDVKLIFQDFLKTIPKEGLAGIQENVYRHFEEIQIKSLMKREKVVSRADLETALRAKGSSLDRERRIFMEQLVAQQWIQQKVKGDKGEKEEEVTHEEMLTWYQAHIKDFEHPAKARWEELMAGFIRHPDHGEAYNAAAALGNRVLAGASLADVAKSASEGPTAREGGQRDWTQKGSLASEALDQAVFSLPVGQLSQILESTTGYHIIRVVERKEEYRTSFLDAQKDVKENIQKERFEKRYKEFVEQLRKKYPVWTVFDNALQQPKNPDDEDRYSTTR